jgi:UDP-3-O-[3-hydroxymyristoyl] glucosamine N-acyltransferase
MPPNPVIGPSSLVLPIFAQIKQKPFLMTFDQPVPVTQIATWIGATLKGNTALILEGINEIHKVRAGDITFVDHPKYYEASLSSAASAIIVPNDMPCPDGKCLLIVEKPFLAYELIVNRYRPLEALVPDEDSQGVHPSAIIEQGAIIGQHTRIGKHSHIQAGAIIRPYSYIGERVIIQSGAVIGAQAFYFKKWPEGYQAWTGCGRVIIEDDVWIGAGTTIAQGVSGDTIIGQGTKIDCQVQIGHGVVIGKHCILAAQIGIAGKSKIGDWCTIYGQVGIAQNLTIGDRTTVWAQSGISKDLEDGKTWFGSPAIEARDKLKEMAAIRMLTDEMINKG